MVKSDLISGLISGRGRMWPDMKIWPDFGRGRGWIWYQVQLYSTLI